jgi:nicotinate-nucleotide adenylyltransferase
MEHVRFIPAYQPPHRENPQTPADIRMEMVAKAIENQPYFVADDRELKRGGPSYMVDTLQSLRADFPEHPLCLIMGLDAFANIDQWHQWQDLLNYAHIIVCKRPEQEENDNPDSEKLWPEAVQEFYENHKMERDQIKASLAGGVCLEHVTQLAISATDIRERLKKHQTIRYLTPDPIINLIKYYNLYN